MPDPKEKFLARWSRLKRATAADVPLAAEAAASPEPLPPLESINLETDITPYLSGKVEEGLKRLALKTLFRDPHFHFANMDRLDTYIDDYSQPDPLPEAMLSQLRVARDYLSTDGDTAAPHPAAADPIPDAAVLLDGRANATASALHPDADTAAKASGDKG